LTYDANKKSLTAIYFEVLVHLVQKISAGFL